MKSRIAVGDIHGREGWKQFAEEDFTEFYILGDYFDSYGLSFLQELRNYQDIIKTAKSDSRFKLCLGNHDYHYLSGIPPDERYSRFEERHQDRIREELESNMDMFMIAYITKDNFLISHAGVSARFMSDHNITKPAGINTLFKKDRTALAFNGCNVYGDDVTQGPLWIRPASLLKNTFGTWTQIVGHTQVAEITAVPGSSGGKVVFIDTGDMGCGYRF